MNYKNVAVYKERQLTNENSRLKVILHNAIVIIEEYSTLNHNELLKELDISEETYKKIMEE